MKYLIPLVMLPCVSFAQDERVTDEVTVEEEGYNIVLTYFNSCYQSSDNVTEEGERKGVRYMYQVEVGYKGPEIFTVKSLTPGYEVIPREVSHVDDCQSVTIYISPTLG